MTYEPINIKGLTLLEAMQKCKIEAENGNKDEAHRVADNILCRLLIAHGYEELTNLYYDIDKWYS